MREFHRRAIQRFHRSAAVSAEGHVRRAFVRFVRHKRASGPVTSHRRQMEGLHSRAAPFPSTGGAILSAVVIRYGLTDSAARIRRRRRSTSRKAMASRSLNADAGGSKTADGGVRSFLNGHLLVSGALFLKQGCQTNVACADLTTACA